MVKIDWGGTFERRFTDPGKVKFAHCGICGSKMKVDRNVLGSSDVAMLLYGRKRRHDYFYCPNILEKWHKRIYALKVAVYYQELAGRPSRSDMKKFKEEVTKEILKLLKKHAVK